MVCVGGGGCLSVCDGHCPRMAVGPDTTKTVVLSILCEIWPNHR